MQFFYKQNGAIKMSQKLERILDVPVNREFVNVVLSISANTRIRVKSIRHRIQTDFPGAYFTPILRELQTIGILVPHFENGKFRYWLRTHQRAEIISEERKPEPEQKLTRSQILDEIKKSQKLAKMKNALETTWIPQLSQQKTKITPGPVVVDSTDSNVIIYREV